MASGFRPITWQTCHLPKQGHSALEYEDAFAANVETGRFAVADGASESSFAGLWAQLLVEGFAGARNSSLRGRKWLGPLQQQWSAAVDALSLPWYAEAKREQGAFATLLGLHLQPRSKAGGTWRALAVGDSCLFQIRGDHLLATFPLSHSGDFGNQPGLLGSRLPAPPSRQEMQRRSGRWQTGDRFLLMTDALAQWFLQECEQNRKPWNTTLEVLMDTKPASDEAAGRPRFAAWIEELRARKEIRNDDVTLMEIQL
jgi:hypothetical protein